MALADSAKALWEAEREYYESRPRLTDKYCSKCINKAQLSIQLHRRTCKTCEEFWARKDLTATERKRALQMRICPECGCTQCKIDKLPFCATCVPHRIQQETAEKKSLPCEGCADVEKAFAAKTAPFEKQLTVALENWDQVAVLDVNAAVCKMQAIRRILGDSFVQIKE
jgi:hypothetical protein